MKAASRHWNPRQSELRRILVTGAEDSTRRDCSSLECATSFNSPDLAIALRLVAMPQSEPDASALRWHQRAHGLSPGHPAGLAGQRVLSHAKYVAAATPWPRASAAGRGPGRDAGYRPWQP